MTEIYKDTLITEFKDPLFKSAFQEYFSELGIQVKDWDSLFTEMDEDGENAAYVRTSEDGTLVGFIMFIPIVFTSWFFESTCGFIREFWIRESHRNQGHGAHLLDLAESFFRDKGITYTILTTDTVRDFYVKRGYFAAPGIKARNQDDVFVKRLDI